MDEEKKSLNPLKAVTTVLSAFSGIRRGEDSRKALAKLNPLQIILAAFLCLACFIGLLLLLVHSIAS
ncbi:MAG: DUF2970 domain-containing protein [Burkholderiales bacterium]|nr:DUF2970 domain-containing protein [Burkholderiales bacterium]